MYLKSAIRKKQIINVAKKMLAEKGYSNTTMRAIAAELNLQVAALYNHFHSKEEILNTICKDVSHRFRMIRMEIASNSELPPVSKFKLFVVKYITELLKDVVSFEIYMKYWNINEIFRKRYSEDKKKFILFVKHLLKDMELTCNSQIYKENAVVFTVIANMNLTPHLLKDKTLPNVEAISEDLFSKLTKGFKSKA